MRRTLFDPCWQRQGHQSRKHSTGRETRGHLKPWPSSWNGRLKTKEAIADHYVLIFSGLGINPAYVRQSLPLESLPKPLRQARGGKPEDPKRQRCHPKVSVTLSP